MTDDDAMCFNCRYATNNGGWMTCRRYPPQWMGEGGRGVWGCEFPTTVGNAWCGEWKRAPQPLDSTGNTC
jgi:hypothetical protein